MEALIYLEVLDRAGRVRERHRLTHFPAVIGRDYSCDVMLDDDYVSPRHLRIEHDAGGVLVAADLKSANGTFFGASTLPAKRASLGPETLLRIGRTHLRLRKPDFPVPAALALSGHGARLGRWLRSGPVFALLLLLTVAMFFLQGYLGEYVKVDWARRSVILIPLVLILTLWAGPWALAGRLFTHEANYLAHASIACLGLLGFFVLDVGYEYLSFAFAWSARAESGFLVLLALLLGSVLFGHLRFSTRQPTGRLWLAGSAAAALLVGLVGFTQHVTQREFSAQLAYSSTLKPLTYRRADSESAADFVARATEIREQVDSEAQE